MSTLYTPAKHLPPLGRSNHQCLLLNPKVPNKFSPASTKVRIRNPKNTQILNRLVALQNWDNVINATDVDDKVEIFNKIAISLLDTAMPEKTIRMHPSDKPWITPNMKAQIIARQKAFTRGDKVKYEQLRDMTNKLIRNAKASYYCAKGKEFRKKDPAKWHKIIYTMLGAEANRTTLQAPTEKELSEAAENLLNAFTDLWKDITTDLPDISNMLHLLKDTSLPLPSLGQVRTCLKHINQRKATAIERIPAWFLKSYCDELTPAIHSIITSSIAQAKYPTAYKLAIVTPVPKVHHPNDIKNDFRQISVLPHIAKIIEKLQVNFSDLKIHENQHAFAKNRSTVSALISMTQNWVDVTDNSSTGRKGVHVMFLDFRKAFDLVDHRILLIKLVEMNVSSAFWSWVKSFLSGRTLQVKLNGMLSSTAACPAGVPQGSVISPTLFNIFIDDLDDPSNRTNTQKYADDCTIDETVDNGALSHMQETTNDVLKWTKVNKMVVNVKKTKDMWINFSQASIEPPNLQIEGTDVERVKAFKLLGVWIQDDFKWNTHIQEVTKRANKLLFLLRECRKSSLPPEIGLLTYTTKIRPILEYASPVWGGIPKYLEEELERVQQRSLKILGLERNILPTLKERRDIATSNELTRITKDPSNPCNRFLIHNNPSYELRRPNGCIPAFLSKTDRHRLSFIPRACGLKYS